DHVRGDLIEDLGKPRVDILRAIDQRLPRGRDEVAELLEGRLPEDRRRITDEVDPELAGHLGLRRRRTETHQSLLEALRLQRPGERLFDDEHDAVTARSEDLADADAIVGRPEGTLRKEDDRARVGHSKPLRVAGLAR